MYKNASLRRLIAALGAVVVIWGATACAPSAGSAGAKVPDDVATETTEPLPDDLPTESTEPLPDDEPAEEEAEPEEAEPALLKFGQTFSWEDGMAVSVSKPKAYKIDKESAAYDESFKRFVVVTITVKNGTSKRYDPNDMRIVASTGDRDSEEAFDRDIGGTPDGTVLKGRTKKFQEIWGVDKGADFVMEIAPTDEHVESIFAS